MPQGEFRLSAGCLVYNAVSPVISRVFRELQEINRLLAREPRAANRPIPHLKPSRLGLSILHPQALGMLKRMVRFGPIAFCALTHLRVPHPRRVFVFAARVGYTMPGPHYRNS
jgi:hypothetical protein